MQIKELEEGHCICSDRAWPARPYRGGCITIREADWMGTLGNPRSAVCQRSNIVALKLMEPDAYICPFAL